MKSGEFLPQYAAQAVIDIDTLVKRMRRSPLLNPSNQHLVEAHQYITSLIRNAVHIVLPTNGEIYRSNFKGGEPPNEDECQSFAGLPAPVCCFEYAYPYDEETGARKRLTITVDHKQIVASIPDGMVATTTFFSVCYSEKHRMWGLATHLALNVAQPLSLSIDSKSHDWRIKCTAVDICTKHHYDAFSSEQPPAQFVGEMFPDIGAVVQCCHALRAGAIFEEHRETSAARRWKFDKRGVGGVTYHVLKLPTAVNRSGVPKGTHDSPRFHVRRAHIRKLPTGVLTFVRQCFVGDREKGIVEKHYKMERTCAQ